MRSSACMHCNAVALTTSRVTSVTCDMVRHLDVACKRFLTTDRYFGVSEVHEGQDILGALLGLLAPCVKQETDELVGFSCLHLACLTPSGTAIQRFSWRQPCRTVGRSLGRRLTVSHTPQFKGARLVLQLLVSRPPMSSSSSLTA